MTPSTDCSAAASQAWGKVQPSDVVLQAAIEHAANGWAVIPVNALTKIPFLDKWQNLGSQDEAQIRAWWKAWPNAMIGVLTGPASGFWALDIDIDPEKGIDGFPLFRKWETENGKLPITVTVDTPRGGRHLYFRWHEGIRNSAGRNEKRGIDWRGEGGFVIVPPSVKADGKSYTYWQSPADFIDIEHAPQWLLDIVLKKPSIAERAQAAIVQPSSYSGGRGYGAAALEAECHELATCASGSRNDQLNRSAFSLAQLVAGGELSEGEVKSRLIEAAGACGLIKDDGRPSVDKTIWSGFNAGLGHPRKAPERPQDGFQGSASPDTGTEGSIASGGAPTPPASAIKATPFIWREPSSFPKRRWLYGHDYARRYVSALIAPGGSGKSSLLVIEALALVTGRDLLGVMPRERVNVWLWSGEDPLEETERRVIAAMMHYRIDPAEVEGRLFLDSGRDTPITIGTSGKDGVKIATPVVDSIVANMLEREIGALLIDPFISSHRVNENANGEVDAVAKQWGVVAERANAAVGLAHHARKPGGAEVTTETSRGASSLMDAARMGRAINRMTEAQATEAGLESHHGFFRIGGADPGKQNMAPPPEGAKWYRLQSVPLGNGRAGAKNAFESFAGSLDDGDHVAVVEQWEWPSCLSEVNVADLYEIQRRVGVGKYRDHHSSPDWIGHLIADVLKLDTENSGHRARIRKQFRTWVNSGALEVYEAKDANREMKNFVRRGSGEAGLQQ